MSSTWMIATNELPDPGAFKVTSFPIGQDQRLANGRLVTDVVCHKKRFEVSWPTITWVYLSPVLVLYEADSFFTLTYPGRGVSASTATVKITNTPDELLHLIESAANDWIFKDFTLTMEEQ